MSRGSNLLLPEVARGAYFHERDIFFAIATLSFIYIVMYGIYPQGVLLFDVRLRKLMVTECEFLPSNCVLSPSSRSPFLLGALDGALIGREGQRHLSILKLSCHFLSEVLSHLSIFRNAIVPCC